MHLLIRLIRGLVALVCWLPAVCIRFLRERLLRSRPVVRLILGGPESRLGHKQLVKFLRRMARVERDDSVRAVLVELGSLSLGFSSLQQIRAALADLRKSGKLIFVQMHGGGLRELYLGSLADRIWLSPMAELQVTGVGATIPFYGDALSRLGVGVELLSAGAYKSFGEPYSRAWPTVENREQLELLLGDLQEQIVEAIAESRKLDPSVIEQAMSRSPLSAMDSVELGLIDGVAYPDEVVEQIRELMVVGGEPLSSRLYFMMTDTLFWMEERSMELEWVPVVHLRGPVVMSESDLGGSGPRISADRVVPVLDALAKDDDCAAVVIAVDSPGGSALASDLIARSVRNLVAKRPVVVWFGNVSASGGYYISAPANEIVANPTTITGSIGVVGGKIVVGEAVGRMGVHHTTIAAGPDTTMMGPWDGFSADQRRRYRESMVRVYERFVQVVASGRDMTKESVLEVAEGRVWTGRQAREHGLVDHLGGLDHAVERAQSLGGISGYPAKLDHIRFAPSRFKALQHFSKGEARRALGPKALLSALGGVLFQAVLRYPGQPLMLMPWEMDEDTLD